MMMMMIIITMMMMMIPKILVAIKEATAGWTNLANRKIVPSSLVPTVNLLKKPFNRKTM